MSIYIDYRESSDRDFEFFDWGLSDDLNEEIGDFESDNQDDESPCTFERTDVSEEQAILKSPDGSETRFTVSPYFYPHEALKV